MRRTAASGDTATPYSTSLALNDCTGCTDQSSPVGRHVANSAFCPATSSALFRAQSWVPM
jgi:hypothetical protein